MKDREYSKDTQNGNLHDLKHFLLSLDNKTVGDVTEIDVMNYLTQVRESGAGARYRNRSQSAIRLFYKVMVRFRVTDHNPAMDIEKAKVEKKTVHLSSKTVHGCLAGTHQRKTFDQGCYNR
ncbi:phage integrase N-terminal SAM-like domain-containing protein [Paenibacillus sp. ISL-20]|uniref:site-specific integrase n=1 Tax=Paenibacillus sp. ISL-20 TaxID=2819163 RepID=UPI00203580B3|nr:phage integrase N-terminal SAM-like domain-containing protein [Paenibacillus sp. ISL-20]